MMLRGKARLLPDDVNTDMHCSSKYDTAPKAVEELSNTMFEKLSRGFAQRVGKGDFIVAGENFGANSSREEAIEIMQKRGIAALLAKSFFRLLYRNAINLGMPAIVCDTSSIKESDELEVDLRGGLVRNLSQKTTIPCDPFPDVVLELLRDGGIIAQIVKRKENG